MTVQYSVLHSNHYSSEPSNPSYISSEKVFEEIGWDFAAMTVENPAYSNTCAVRMSLAFLKSGISFTGRLRIKAGTYKDKKIEPGAKLLADQAHGNPKMFGKTKVMTSDKAQTALVGKKGLIFFHKITDYGGGHIDVLNWVNVNPLCHSNCYFNCKQVWFWELP